MAGGAGAKTKGASGERELCKLFANLFEGSFVRVPSSGAFVGGKNSFRKQTMSANQIAHAKGDIVPPDHMPRLVLEAKWYKDFSFHGLLTGSAPLLDDWIAQSLDAIDPGDEWFVAFKINRLGWWISVPEAQASHYTFDSHCRYQGKHGTHYVTEMLPWLERNKATILARSA